MNIRRLQGWALILSAVLGLIGLAGFLAGSDTSLFRAINLVGGALFIVGVPALLSFLPAGAAGLGGVVLLELGAVIAFVLNLLVLTGAAGFNDALPLTSAVAGLIGAAVVGWMTTREKVFAAWIGWAFILQGVLNFIGGVFDLGSLTTAVVVITVLVDAAALFGYGLAITRQPG
jgi:hypothetical protein